MVCFLVSIPRTITASMHARRVAALGFDLTGLDQSAVSIREACRYAGDRLRFRAPTTYGCRSASSASTSC